MNQNIPQISADDVYKAVVDGADIVLIDVRTPGEYGRGKIEGSINIPVDDIAHQAPSMLMDKSKQVYAYCLSGARSDVAVGTLSQLGYSRVFSMTNGLLIWRAKKFPLTT